jgi:phosphodiesterase/alkaline phosphatase D-like protein
VKLVRALALAALLLVLLPAAASAAPGFSFGVAAGDVGLTSALLWTRADQLVPVTVEVTRAGGRRTFRATETPDPAHDNTVQIRVRGLRPNSLYRYRFVAGPLISEVGVFTTAPPRTSREVVRFAISGDADGTLAPGASAPAFNNFEVYGRMAVERNDFNINLGDTIYSDSGVGRRPRALTLPDKWAKYRENLVVPNLALLRRAGTVYSGWGDHEFVNNFSIRENGRPLYEAGKQAFLDYWPTHYSLATGLYRRFRWGRNLELFFLDERTFRSAKASLGSACNNAFGRFSDDLAPAAPQRIRDSFGAAIPPLRNPVPPLCLGVINDSRRTFLGRTQLKRFLHDVSHSTATFKVIVTETPIQQFYLLPYDRWEGYAWERDRVLRTIKRFVPNAVFLATDSHANLVNDVRFVTFERGGPLSSGALEFVTGPVATNTFARESANGDGTIGARNMIARALFKPPPPAGVGMSCAALDTYSYAEVAVGRRRLVIEPKDPAGRPVREQSGAQCGRYTVMAKPLRR